MEISTIIRILEVPTGGIDPSELPSGSLLYVENIGTDGLGALYYAGGDNGFRKSTYLKQVTSVPGGGTEVAVSDTITGSGTILSPLKSFINTTDDFIGNGLSSTPLALSPVGLANSVAGIVEAGNNIIINYDNVGNSITISATTPGLLDGGSA